MIGTLDCMETCAGDTWWIWLLVGVAAYVFLAAVDALVPPDRWWGRVLHALAGNLRRASSRMPPPPPGAP